MPKVEVKNEAIKGIEMLLRKLRFPKSGKCRNQVKVVHLYRNCSIYTNHDPHLDYIEIAVFDFPSFNNEHLYVVVYGFIDSDVIVASGTAKQVIEQLRPDPEELKDAAEGDDTWLNYAASRIVEILDKYNKKAKQD